MLRKAVHLACAVIATTFFAEAAFAQPLDKRTIFTFSGPVAVPGAVLPAGQYIFRVIDSNSRVVQVLSGDGMKHHTLFFSMPAERLETTDKPEVRFMETPAGMPQAIRTWWYPGERRGYEFVYPKDEARRFVQGMTQPVLTTQAQTATTGQTNTNELTRISSTGQETNVNADTAPTAAAPTGASQQGELASTSITIATPTVPAVSAAGSASDANAVGNDADSARSARKLLPKTATNLGGIAIIGSLALGAGLTLSWLDRRRTGA